MKTIHVLTNAQLEEQEAEFTALLKGTKRKGAASMLSWLKQETDFFTAPASTRGHGNFEGGLVVHSINVYKLLKSFAKKIENLSEDSLVIVGLLHDVCKANFYKQTVKNVKVPGEKRWEEEIGYMIDDAFPLGHGEKSLFLVQRHIELKDDEAMAIRWHMSGYDDAARGYAGGMAQSAAYEKYPLAAATAIADMYTTYFLDKKNA